jgi:hypothetical protein
MTARNKATTNDKPQSAVQVLEEGTCATASGTLVYQVGTDEQGSIKVRIASNSGGGFFSDEWVAFADIQSALAEWPADKGISSVVFRKTFVGRSSNSPGFLVRSLSALGLLSPMPNKKRLYEVSDPSAFLERIEALKTDSGSTAPKAKTRSKAKSTARSTAKVPRKTTTRRKKSS